MNWKSGKFLAIASLFTVAAIASASYALVSLGLIGVPSYPQIVINLEFLKKDPSTGKFVDASGILNSKDVMVELQINAIAPPTESDDIITLHSGVYAGKGPIVISTPLFQNLSREWVSVYKSRSVDPSSAYSGLIIRAIAFNTTSRQMIFQVYDSISYSPYQVANGNSLFVTIQAENSTAKALSIDTSYSKNVMLSSKAEEKQIGIDIAGPSRIEVLVAQITPENLTSYLPSDYFMNVNGKLYMKVPVLIFNNSNAYSATMNVYLNISAQSSGVIVTYPTFSTTGNILDSIKNGQLPNVNFYMGSSYIWGGKTYNFQNNYFVPPQQVYWVWMWARPVIGFYKVYDMWQGYMGDEVQGIVSDVYVSGSDIQGGDTYGAPSQTIMNMLFNGTSLNFVTILAPNEGITLSKLFNAYGSDFEIGLPIGSLLASAACLAIGAATGGIGGIACEVAVMFTETIGISLSAYGSNVYITGFIQNVGDSPFISNDYNTVEGIYVAVSNYTYILNSHQVNPPLGIYIDSR
jgi:hypothetical protein